MRRHVLFVALVLALPVPALAGNSTAEALASTFCTAMVEGAPDPVTLVTPALGEAIERAMARNAGIQAAMPDEKPPLGDGVPWSSWPDRPDSCQTEITEAYDGAAMINITYAFSGAPDATYTDTLILMQGEAGWAIDDVVLVDNHSLTDILKTVFDP